MARRKFNVGHFPQGTVARFQIVPHEQPEEITVDRLSSNGPGSWVILSNEKHKHIKNLNMSVNISHIREIVSRGAGPVLIEGVSEETKRILWKDSMLEYVKHTKHHSQYHCTNVNRLVYLIAIRYIDYTMILDNDRLSAMVLASGIFKKHTCKLYDHEFTIYVVNQKKLQNRIKQLIPKCLCRHEVAKRIENAEMSALFERDMDYLYNNI